MDAAMSSGKTRAEITQSSVHLDAVRGIAALIVVTGHVRGLFFSSLFTPGVPAARIAIPSQASAGDAVRKDPKITIGHEAVMIFLCSADTWLAELRCGPLRKTDGHGKIT
jgi:hypothetical protein